MNEERQQAYLNLIEMLLSCQSGEEAAILEAKQDLLDAEFVQIVKAVAEFYSQEGEENTANWLRNLAVYVGQPVYLEFLLQVLQATSESNGDPQVVYPLLEENIEKLDYILPEVLQSWAKDKLAEVETDTAEYIAGVIGNFSNLIGQFPLGDKASNMEIAIAGYEILLTVYTRTAFPQQWATVQNNLGTAYSNRIDGDKAQNLEKAIAAYSQALEIRTRTAFPQQWATTQNNLGNAYRNRIDGDKAQNLEKAIAAYTQALEIYTRSAFPQDWAMTQNNLGTAYSNRIDGDKAQNLELAIAAYTQALEIYTRTAFPQQWATTQNNLGNAYLYRIDGDKAQNLEKAIAAYTQALEIYTRSAFPQDWATTQNNLGNAYLYRIDGDKAQNLEKAISAYTQALEIYTRTAFPQQWATVQNNLGNAYLDRIDGDKAQNLELAISAYSQALEIYTRTAFPQDWAGTQNNLGNAYLDRIDGDKAQNLEKAIAAYSQALEIRTRSAFPQDWATTQNNLGNAYSNRIDGDKAQNLEKAIAAYTQALEIRTRSAFPQDWASTQNNLGNAYLYRIDGDKAQNLEKAISAYTQALEIRTRSAFPQDWATTQNNLGSAYSDRIDGDKAQNLELAIAAFSQALEIYTRTAFPQHWASTQNNLGTAYSNRIDGDKAQNLELAIAAFSQALEIYTRSAFPQKNVETLFNLGLAYQDGKHYTFAYNSFESAIETVEFLRGEIVSGEESKRKQAEEWNGLYRRMVEVCLKLEQDTQAIEYIERSKTRNLVELLAIRNLYPTGEIPEDKRKQLQQIRKDIDIEKRRLAADTLPDHTYINQLRQRYSELYPYEPIQFSQIQSLLAEDVAIIQLYIFGDCFRAFIITCNEDKPRIWHSSAEDLEKLVNWTFGQYLQSYYRDKKRWIYDLNNKLQELAQILHIDEILSLIPTECKKLILIPHRYLHLLPLHALVLSTGEDLIEKFPKGVSYAPSCELLRFAFQRLSQNHQVSATPVPKQDLTHLFAIQNPTDNLDFTDIEVETIAAAFQPHHILKKDEATLSAIKQQPSADHLCNAKWLHFSGHAYFNYTSPLKSALQLADSLVSPVPADAELSGFLQLSDNEALDLQKCLTLEEIFQLSLPECRLVMLSACETGLIDFYNKSDEYIGLASGFIRAGAVSVVSTLWAVDDFSTALLIIKFYENLETLTSDVVISLNQAQLWFRQVTQSDLVKWIDDQERMDVQHKQSIRDVLTKNYKPEQKPFQNSWAWAGFCAVGA
ncbi:MAG: tetratricopeptide repeat protein [Aetokthonos hydrillicola CCALA 1050]|jgi:CHAT domain-containing protein/ppGpp synthetase/RelA/SpoT-type nucleotidyltranferase|nr:tetratricopeptide repeat protein [Aetokthonos hydrillicola CCALA 1050]